MVSNTNMYNTLFLVIQVNEGVLPEYQRQLYEASLLGIKRVLYCHVFDSNGGNNHNRLDRMIEKLEMVCRTLNIQSFDRTMSLWPPFSCMGGSKVIKTNDEGIISNIGDNFDYYKEKNHRILENREKIGKVLVKSSLNSYSQK